MTPPRIACQGLTFRYSDDPGLPPVLDAIDLGIDAGQFVILTGPSGSGKSTLMTLIGGLRRVQAGTLSVLGDALAGAPERALEALRRRIGFIFQDHNLFDALTPQETLQLAMDLHAERYRPQDYRQRPQAWLHRMGLEQRRDALPRQLSTGQRQRVAVARAMINEPDLILADEPTASLDPHSAELVLQALQEAVRERGATLLMISHDPRQFALADRVITLVDGRLVS
ncbi:MAG: ABC transporter ATP-binding protein [Betaproteobacteria bacterium]|nr:ABC transporter ATP-binding protein [Betaproteobacteria bacterium]